MYEITDLWVKNYVHYKSAHVQLNKHPLVVARGLNLDRKNDRSSNAVGKSTLFAAIPSLRFNAPPMSIKKNDTASAFGKEGSIKLRVKHGKHVYDVEQFSKGKSVAYNIAKNNVDRGIRKVKDAQKYIEKHILPITDDQFYTFNYLSPRDFNVLHRGKAEQRFDYFEKLFGLGVYDKIFAVISKEYNQIKAQKQNLDFVKGERENLGNPVAPKPLKKRLARLERNMLKVQKRIANYRDEQQHISAFLTIAEGLDLETPLDKLKSDYAAYVKKEEKLASDYEVVLKQWEAFNSYKETAKLLKEAETLLKATPEVEFDEQTIEARIEKFHSLILKNEDLLKETKRCAKQVFTLRKEIDALQVPKKWAEKAANYTAKQLSDLVAKSKHAISAKRDIILALPDGAIGSVCPTCNQKIDVNHTKSMRKSLQDEITALTYKIDNYRKLTKYLELTEEILAVKLPTTDIDEVRQKVAKFEKKWYDAKEQRYNLQKRLKIQARIKDLKSTRDKAPVKPLDDVLTVKKALGTAQTKASETKHTLMQRKRLLNMEKTYGSVNEAKTLHKKYNAFIELYQPKLDRALSMFQKLSVKIANNEQNQEKIKELEGRLNKLVDATQDFDIYEALREAYGAKGLRILQISNLAKMYCARLNKYAHLIFPEPITFTTIVDKSRFDIIATRNGKSSDVRRLSGSESTSFILLSLIAMLPYVPANKRLNLLIIDEVEIGLDVIVWDMFINKLLPVLNSIIPNIVLITPKSQDALAVPGAKELLITRNKGISSVKFLE